MSDKLTLVKPSEEYIDEICAYRQEFFDDGGHFNGDSGLRKFEDISAWILQCRRMENNETMPNPDWVETEQFMLVRKGERNILDMINFRHCLNDYLAKYAGHIGYAVRPCERRKGYAKSMLALCLEQCRRRGLDKVLITCDTDNEASRRTILACGGVFERFALEGDKKLERYWVMLDNPVITHYDALIDENNDPVYDPAPLKAYMNKWDGDAFIEALALKPDKSVLEIGVGTGRLALKVCPHCARFTGIDFSPKTVDRAKENLLAFSNAYLICGDFLTYTFQEAFGVIYSSLTFMHIKNKTAAIQKAAALLQPSGRLVLSIDKNRQTVIDYGTRKIPVFPDTPEETAASLTDSGLVIEQQFETEFAVIFVAVKGI